MTFNPNACSNCGFASPPTHSDSYLTLPALPERLLRTNELPTDLEFAQIEKAITDRKARISQLDKAIAALQSSLEQYRRMRQAAVDQISRGVGVLSVVRRIPTDILAEIFNWTVPDEARKHATHRCPWVLGRVCSRRRVVSLALPELW
ncbi:hypothetical protein C8R45DRAFT_823678, partial [Mycena sanguinolenta]